MTDLIIGGCSNYSWNEIKYWVNSIRKTSFSGDVVLVTTKLDDETSRILKSKDVIVHTYNSANAIAPHVERLFHIWDYLDKVDVSVKYNHIITTDVRDVVFQSDPSLYLRDNLSFYGKKMICSSEGLVYKDEPWGSNNYKQAFGPFFYEKIKDKLIYNVGTLAGEAQFMTGFLLNLFQLSINRPIPIVDQAVFNFMINSSPYKEVTNKAKNVDGWAIQLGTTELAIEAGSGDIGLQCKQNPSMYVTYLLNYKDEQPLILDNQIWATKEKERWKRFVVVHQYDRIPELKEKIENLYGVE